MDTLLDLENRLKVLESKIEDCSGRMPAHSAKPGMMEELMDLEDERDRIQAEIQTMEKSAR
jgi:hypothetical protein